ncbi:class I SAM-dependent methyltransferase [Bacteroidota bacterium]
MKDISTKRIKRVTSEELYEGEGELISEAISQFENLSCAELAWLLDETCVAKRKLPSEFRIAFRIRNLSDEEKKIYYMHYCKEKLNEGNKQLELLKKVLCRLKYESQNQITSVLDFGTGRGGFLSVLQKSTLFPQAKFQGIDIDMASLLINQKINDDLDNEDYSLVCYSGEKLPYDDQSFDLVASFSALEHVGNIEKQYHILAECSRCLKPKGIAIFRFPNKHNIFTLEEHVKIPFLHFLPNKIKDVISYRLSGMPSSDIYPPGIFELREVLKKTPKIRYKLYSEVEFHRKKIIALVFRNYMFRIIGPGIVLVIMKN